MKKGSEARLIIEETGCGYLTEPGRYDEVEMIIQKFIEERDDFQSIGTAGREYLVKNLTKDVSVRKYIEEISTC